MKGRDGYTLAETMIAMLLVAMIVTSVFAMVVTAKTGAKKSESNAKAHFYARQQMEKLKSYVSADRTAPGPLGGSVAPEPDNWKFPGDSSNLWALQGDTSEMGLPHNVSGNLPADWSMVYYVKDVSCGTKTCKRVMVTVSWPGP